MQLAALFHFLSLIFRALIGQRDGGGDGDGAAR
jgi:hypothetical protein